MLNSFQYRKWIALLGLIFCNLIFINSLLADVVVIVHPDNTSTFDEKTIKKIFLGKTKAFNNGRVAILLSPKSESPARHSFNKLALGKTEGQVNAYWSKMMFTGKGVPPQEMGSANEIISAVAANRDAISFIDASAATGAVKIVATYN